MDINEFILQNEALTTEMKIFISEVQRLEKIRLLLRDCPIPDRYNMELCRAFQREIFRHKTTCREINTAYDEKIHKQINKEPDMFIKQVRDSCKEIEVFLLSIKAK